MASNIENMEGIQTPALEKYGLAYLKTKNPGSWTATEIDEFVDALSAENIAPILLIPFEPKNIKLLLSQSFCRRCGQCCISNTFNTCDPGILVFEKELKVIAKHSNYSYKHLKKLSVKHNNPERDDVRHLKLPCMFHKQGICTIYDVRPFICRIYPIKDTPQCNNRVYVSVSLRCEYGKDIYKNAVQKIKSGN